MTESTDPFHDPSPSPARLPRRREVLKAAGALGLGAACVGAGAPPGLAAMRAAVLRSSCTLTPAQTPGPFYLNLGLQRYDITEGLPGVRMYTFVRVLEKDGCTPIPGAVVELWHTEAGGDYSGVRGQQGQTWMRGIQPAGRDGVAHFKTIYPGWYPGRTTHVHAKINPNQQSELTTQFYFDDAFTDWVYKRQPYKTHGRKDTSNQQDALYDPQLEMGLIAAPSFAFLGNLIVASGITVVIDE